MDGYAYKKYEGKVLQGTWRVGLLYYTDVIRLWIFKAVSTLTRKVLNPDNIVTDMLQYEENWKNVKNYIEK